MSYNDKEAVSGFDVTANEMLRRLNNQYKADKFADKYTENAEYLKAEDGSIQIDISTLSDEEFKTLFASYLATSNMNVSDMTDSTYKSLQYHIINLQKKSGAMLLTGDEMEKHFEDAQNSAHSHAYDPEESAATMEIPVPPKGDIFADDEKEFGATTEFIMHDSQMFRKLSEEAKPQMIEEEKSEAEQIKEHRMTVFSKLRALMRASATEEIPMGLETSEMTMDIEPAVPVEEDMPEEPATEEFIIPSYIANEAENAADNFEEETTPEEDMLENYLEDTSELEAYVPNTEAAEEPEEAVEEITEETAEETAEEIAEEITDETAEETAEEIADEIVPEEMPEIEDFEEEEEIPDEIVPEEPAEYIAEEVPEEEAESFADEDELEQEDGEIFAEEAEAPIEKAEIIDALAEDEREEGEEEQIFDEPAEDPEEEEEPEEDDGENIKDYTSFEQNPEIFAQYKKKYTSVRVRMGISIAIAAILLVIENISMLGLALPDFFYNRAIMVPVEWTLVFADALLVCYPLFGALKKLVKFKFEPATVTLIAFVLASASTLSALFTEGNIRFFNFSFAICVLFELIASFLAVRKEIFTFKVISSVKKKHAVVHMSAKEAAAEAQEFKPYISEKSEFYRVDEADFVGDYFAQKKNSSAVNKRLRVIIPVIFAASCAVAVLCAFILQAGVYESLAFGYLTFVLCAPVVVFFTNELPIYLSSVKAYSGNSAILGDSASEMMENMSVLSFADSDVFKTDGVRIKGVKVIGNNRIDHIIYYASAVFDLAGGPLAKVFKQASLESAKPESAEIRVISAAGIDAAIDGNHIIAGTEQFMETQCFRPERDDGDENWEGKTNRRILYLACNEEIIAKFYVEYGVSAEFVALVKTLAESGICVSVRTNDPCVDVDIFYKNKLDPQKYPICVVKGENETSARRNVSAKKSGIVAAGSIKGLIKTILVCDRLANVMKTNRVVKVVSAIAGVLIMGALVFMGITLGGAWLWSLYFGLYQLAWLVPVYIISKIYI